MLWHADEYKGLPYKFRLYAIYYYENMNLKYILFIPLLLLSCSDSSFSIYVSPTGNDGNDGSIDHPFETIQRAQMEAREKVEKGSYNHVQVILRGGDYYLTETIHLNEKDANKITSVTYQSYEGEKVCIYGGIRVIDWERWNDNLYRVKLPDSLRGVPLNVMLETNGRAMPMARYPDLGKGFGQKLEKITNTNIRVPQKWQEYDFSHAQVYGWIGANWFSELRQVKAFDRNKLILTVDPGSGSFGGLNSRIYIQGVPELLDVEGEWCVNYQDNYLYYWPVKGDKKLQDRNIVLPILSRVFDVKGSSSKELIENLSFKGLSFIGSNFSSSWQIFKEGEDGSMPCEFQEGLIYIENAARIQLTDCEIFGAGHSAVYINNKSEECKVEGCHIADAGFCGIYANSYYPNMGNFKNVGDSYINKKHTFTNNYIHDCGKYIGGGCGIQLFQSGDNVITHNLIHEMPRYGISYKGVRNGVLVETLKDKNINYANHFDYVHTRNNYIAYNEIFNVCRSSFDFGAIESWGAGKDNVWDCNAIHDIDQTVEWDGWAHGLFPDDASDYLTVKNNIVYELKGGRATGAIMVKSYNQKVENNIFADNVIGRAMTMAPFAEPAAENCVRNNIIYHSGEILYDTDMNSFGTDFYGFYENEFNKQYVKGKPVFTEVDKNIIYPAYDQLDSLNKKGWDVHSLVVDPLFNKQNSQEDITYFDYRLKANSPADNTGFQAIEYDKIGLLPDFSFNVNRKKKASELIEAESYNRMRNLRSIAATGIYHMEPGAWAKYDSIDFSQGGFEQCCMNLLESDLKMCGKLFELRLDSLGGEVIGVMNGNNKVIPVKPVKGVHNLYLIFQQPVALDSFRFIDNHEN